MIQIVRTTSQNQDFRELVKLLDADLAIRNGDDHSFYAQYNKLDNIKYAVVAYEDSVPVGCGAIKEYEAGTMEVKWTAPLFAGCIDIATVDQYVVFGHITCSFSEPN